jgi:hypothetical protein
MARVDLLTHQNDETESPACPVKRDVARPQRVAVNARRLPNSAPSSPGTSDGDDAIMSRLENLPARPEPGPPGPGAGEIEQAFVAFGGRRACPRGQVIRLRSE